jgi:copper chaperone CopZ
MKEIMVRVPNISCGHCVHTIEMEVSDLEGVLSVSADESTKEVVIQFKDPATEEEIKTFLAGINYPPEGW